MAISKVICVLGMARSGTSLITNILNLLGVYLGPEKHLGRSRSFNVKGTFEHTLLQEVNKEILSRLGGNWHNPPVFPEGWERVSEFEDLREEARTVIQKDFADKEIWAWKDPRNCLTLPFWQQVVPSMQYVVCLRNPMDVMRSLEGVTGFSFEKGLYLWFVYLGSILKHTTGHKRIFVYTDKLIDNWKYELQRLYRFLGIPEQTDVEDAAQGFFDVKLWHYRTFTEMLPVALQVHESLSQVNSFSQANIDQTLQEAINIIGPEARKKEAWKKQLEHNRYSEQMQLAIQELNALIPLGESFILIDQGHLGSEITTDWRVIPFLERDGQYCGPPPDDATALREFERLRRSGAMFLVVVWPAFWWLDFYVELHHYLRSQFRCVLQNEQLIIFDLRS